MSSHNALGIRVIELPACKMAVAAGAALPEFDRWWSELDKQRADKFYPRDFMYHDAQMNQLVWLYALPAAYGELCPYPLHDFPGGCYAVAVSIDQNDADGERVHQGIKAWIEASDALVVDESQDRPTLFNVITSDRAHAKLTYRQLDIYVPVR
jgi:hypothetical protein